MQDPLVVILADSFNCSFSGGGIVYLLEIRAIDRIERRETERVLYIPPNKEPDIRPSLFTHQMRGLG